MQDDDDDDDDKRREWKMRGVYWRRVNRVSIRPPLHHLFPQHDFLSDFFLDLHLSLYFSLSLSMVICTIMIFTMMILTMTLTLMVNFADPVSQSIEILKCCSDGLIILHQNGSFHFCIVYVCRLCCTFMQYFPPFCSILYYTWQFCSILQNTRPLCIAGSRLWHLCSPRNSRLFLWPRFTFEFYIFVFCIFVFCILFLDFSTSVFCI